ncbi:LysR family transcriptional regulator [Cardiobacterium hominis]
MPHLRDRLHFSTLMVFMEFCRTRSVSQTAANLGKSKAHVSVQLKTFAEQSGLTL